MHIKLYYSKEMVKLNVVEYYSAERQIDCLRTKCILNEENEELLCDILFSTTLSKSSFFDKKERTLFRAVAHYIMEVSIEPKTLNDVIVFLENSTPEDIAISFMHLEEKNPDSKAVKMFSEFVASSIFNCILETYISLSHRLRKINNSNVIL